MARWLRRTPVFGRVLTDWETHGGVRRPVKFLAVGAVIVVVTLSVTLTALPVSATEFIFPHTDARLTFRRNDKGEVTGVTLRVADGQQSLHRVNPAESK